MVVVFDALVAAAPLVTVPSTFTPPNCMFTKYEKKYLVGTCKQKESSPSGTTICIVPARNDGVTLPPEPPEFSRIHTYCAGVNTECVLEYIVQYVYYGICQRSNVTNEDLCYHSNANFNIKCNPHQKLVQV